MVQYIAADDVAAILLRIERDLRDMLAEGDLDANNLHGTMVGYYADLGLSYAQALLGGDGPGRSPEAVQA